MTLAEVLHNALAYSPRGCYHPKTELAQCDTLATILEAEGYHHADACRPDKPTSKSLLPTGEDYRVTEGDDEQEIRGY